MIRHTGIFLAVLALSFNSLAFAQSQTPSSVEPGRIAEDIREQLLAPTPEQVETPAIPQQERPANADQIRFELQGVTLNGVTVYGQDDLAPLYDDMIGQDVTLADIYDLSNQITAKYRNDGYLLARSIVPPQEIDDGRVEITVVEGRVGEVQIQGDPRGGTELIQSYADKIVDTNVLTAEKLERYLLLANDVPGLRVRGVLSPSTTQAGAAVLTMVVEQDRAQGYLSADNYGNSFIGPERFIAGGNTNSLFGQHERISATFLTAPDDGELFYGSLAYDQLVGSEGTSISLSASQTYTDPSLPSSLGGGLGVEGDSTVVSANVTHPLIRSRSHNLSLGGQFDVIESKNEYDPAFSTLDTEDRLRIARLNARGSFADAYLGFNTASVTLSQGLDIFDASDENDSVDQSRAEGESSFTKIEAEITRLQRFTNRISLFAGVSGQYSFDPLLAFEEFGVGGRGYGRGYDASEITADHGLAGKLELRFSNAVPQFDAVNSYRVYGFYDIGAVWQDEDVSGGDDRRSLASTGVGLQLDFVKDTSAEVEVSLPLTRIVESRGEDDGNDVRGLFSVTHRF